MADVQISQLSEEYIKIGVTVAGGKDPTADVVQIAITPAGAQPSTWVPAVWENDAGVYYAKILVGPGSTIGTLGTGRHQVWVKITDNLEIPVLRSLDTLTVF